MEDRTILAIETTGRACSVALMRGGQLIASDLLDVKMSMHSKTVMCMADHVLENAGVKPGDIDIFAAGVGPGSFTGVRIGICTAKGLAGSTGKKVYSGDTLDVLAQPFKAGKVCAMIDARRGEAYFAVYEDGKKITKDSAAPVAEIIGSLGEKALFVGDAAEVNRELILKLMPGALFAEPCMMQARAEHLCFLAAAAADKGGLTEPEDMTANYVRESGAVRKKQGD